MPKVILKGYIEIPEADLEAVIGELENHIQLTLAEKGCLRFDVSRDQSKSKRFNVHEEFESRSAFLQHQDRVRKSKWGVITNDVQRFYEIEGMDSP